MSFRAGSALAAAQGVEIDRDEQVVPFGDGFLLRDRGGFEPCPWAFALARFAPARAGDRVLDLGTGGGVLLLALSQLHPDLGPRVGVEIDLHACSQAQRNARLSGLPLGIVRGDVRARPFAPRAFDLVVSNPPFYRPGWGRESSDGRVHASTHAVHGNAADFCIAAAHALAPHGRAVFVYDAAQLPALVLALHGASLTVKALRFLTDDRGLPSRVLLLAGRDGGGLRVDLG